MKPSRGQILLVALAIFGLSVAGFIVHGPVGGLLLLLVAAVLVTLSVGVWGEIRRQGRPARILIAAALVAIAIAKLADRL
jgi:hypothetical protein